MVIKAVIFDMDGLLIDSEPLWQEAEILIFKQVNILLTSELCLQTKGLRIDEVVDYWYQRHPWTNLAKQKVEELIIAKVIELIHLRGEPLPGVDRAISFVQQKQVKIALASSSASKIIQAVLQKLELTNVFAEVYSAESEVLGKPHPGVYLTTANKLNVSPSECLALEDSLNGVLAAKAAQMKCIAIPEPLEYDNPKFAIADTILKSLAEFNDDIWHSLS
ncbi:hexitol phosphatase HxpB [Pleurocapsa sp. FMAR1]|uniref:hexitol phosphatase HxpB n=1 Tax=Pleurocapsa sp. FMAR1 TaxID=3040204 RepID=UPI0029C76ABA|nr:hexitol phosphatase HxpB [Pleurocapsa sp. FMAR1]